MGISTVKLLFILRKNNDSDKLRAGLSKRAGSKATRPVGQGVGLGLSVTHNLVEKHSGFIEINSKPGIGSCFNVFIPIGNPPQSMPNHKRHYLLAVGFISNLASTF
ncbi:ATP-binding protein [Vibrio caribbeanicus]|uniref:ATP-binding protein n=1 Tax=Vibrio caribbeanicus TaxID=701175 RepID=UPI0022849EF2|nr:ATP-binding protein [Vibrio caribbeanicus]MCY9845738.1 ATP-binding protein [Vibrio caribbeanicus]